MCKAPLTLQDGTQVACHVCSQCHARRINDWVGRNIAESKTAVASYAVTLTYGRSRLGDVDHERAAILTYSDVQKYLKLLRRHRYSVRYFVTGEYGGLKGRSHWHIVLHFGKRLPLIKRGKVVDADMSPVPAIAGVVQGKRKWLDNALDKDVLHQRVDERGEPVYVDGEPALWWPHGWSHWTEGTSAANIRYNCKYVLKNVKDPEAQGHLAMSKKPPLGAAYFRQMAERYVAQGLAPQSLGEGLAALEYRFPEVTRRKEDGRTEVVPFALHDRSLVLFLEHYVATWKATYPGRPMPRSELVEEFVDPGAWRERSEGHIAPVGPHWRPAPLARKPFIPTPEIEEMWDWEFDKAMQRRYGPQPVPESVKAAEEVYDRQARLRRAYENVESDRRARRGEKE